MKSLLCLALATLALCALTSAQSTELQCRSCIYIQDDPDTDANCEGDFGQEVNCSTQLYEFPTNETDHIFYCAKFTGTTLVEDVERQVLIRNCFTNDDGSAVAAEELACVGEQAHYFFLGDVLSLYTGGELCLCDTGLCNSASSLGLHLALIGMGLVLTKALL